MKKYILIITSILLFTISAFSEAKTKPAPRLITISGYVSDSMARHLKDTLQLFLHNRYDANLWHEGECKYVKIVNNRFSVTFQPKGEFAYIQIKNIEDRMPGIYLHSLEYDSFLINAGASININFKDYQSAEITGLSSELFNYQSFAGKIVKNWGKDWEKYPNQTTRLNYWRKLADSHLRLCMDSLNKIKPLISDNAYKILSFNTASAIFQYHLNHLKSGLFLIKDSVYLNTIRTELKSMDIQQRAFTCTDSLILQSSSGYISYLSNFQKDYVDIMNEGINNFDDLYNKITKDYTGVLRDKILTYNIVGAYERRGSQQFVKSAMGIVKDPESKKTMEKIYKVKTPGVDAFDFSFTDVNNKQMKLKDFKGKIVVIEAYFNGCSGCIGLSTRMHPIIESYKNNKNVVFISLSVDKRRDTFLNGVKQGIYGSERSIYLNTNGLGWEHPICLQYQWFSYPQMLIINKNGKLITAEKIDPVDETRKSYLLSLIDKNI